MGLWSPDKLRNGVENWEEITPDPLRKAVAALRKRFATSAWKVGEIMRQGCHPALHKGMVEQAQTIREGIKKLGYPALPSVDQGRTETTVFTAYFDTSVLLLAKEVQETFAEFLEIASAQSAVIGRDPVDWASLQTRVMVADESHTIPIWTKDACDKQQYDSSDSDENIYWRKWRAPSWFFMQPFANRPYDQSSAWERMNEEDTRHLLEAVENRFNQRLIMALDKAVDDTHVRLAKQDSQNIGTTTGVIGSTAPQVPAEPVTERGRQTDLWRDFHEKFQALADEELKEGAAQRDRFIRAYFTYRRDAEILKVRRDARWAFSLFGNSDKLLDAPKVLNAGIPPHGPFCLIRVPEFGLWALSDGGNENFQERFQTVAARAGVALGCLENADPVDFWLHRLVLDLRDNRSKLLFADSGEDGMIVRACEASAIFCSRLERFTLEPQALVNRRNGKCRKPERGDPEVAKRRSLVRSNPYASAEELCGIFDREKVLVPFKWQDAGLKEWNKAYRHSQYRGRIDVLVSKDRQSG